MTVNMETITPGTTLTYNDGRPGHTKARARVLSVSEGGLTAQFEDRADTKFIAWDDKAWTEHITFDA
jgi:hypothetical protein